MPSPPAAARRYFEDLGLGEVQESRPRTISREEMLTFSRQYDPQYFHADEELAKGSIFHDVIASGIYTMAIWRQLDHEIAHDIAWICGIAWNDVRFRVAVRAGDTVRARSICLSKRESGTDPRRGVVEYRYELRNQRDEVAWECVSVNLVERRPAAPGGASGG
jgi:acyl dehydratase